MNVSSQAPAMAPPTMVPPTNPKVVSRELTRTRSMVGGSTRGVTALRNTPKDLDEAANAARRPCCRRSSAGPINGAITANGAMVMSRYSATLLLDSAVAAAKKSVLARATAMAASTAKLAITG
ncbi:Uncharacterised protein [Mycobacteroides abscessus subsp. massiliense]|nr:Uncharacterised protein [Mycobacteroides abscessus subsp. massiliense]